MTKRDYIKIAKAFRDSKPTLFTAYTKDARADGLQEALNYGARAQWTADVIHVNDMLAADNPNFISDLFLAACGEIIRPDGAMYVMNWERGVIA